MKRKRKAKQRDEWTRRRMREGSKDQRGLISLDKVIGHVLDRDQDQNRGPRPFELHPQITDQHTIFDPD